MQFRLPTASAANSAAAVALTLALVVWGLLAVAAVFVMTLGTDEAWVLNGLRSALRAPVAELSTEMIVTSGGAFALVNLLIEWVAGSQVWLHRLPSLLFLGLACWLVVRQREGEVTPGASRWLMLAPLIAVPGTAEVGTAALGTSTGVFLMLASTTLWTSPTASAARRVIGGGLLYGLAAASRFDLVLFGPAVVVASCLSVTRTDRLDLRLNPPVWAFLGLGLAVFGLNHWSMTLPASNAMAGSISASTGLSGWSLDYPKLLNHWLTASTLAPMALLAVMAASAFWSARPAGAGEEGRVPRQEWVLLITGLLLLGGWLFRAPIPHLRYAFPGLFCFAALGAIGLERAASGSGARSKTRAWLLCRTVGLACVIGSIGTTVRSLTMSDSDYVSWEWTGEMSHDYFRRFEARQDQSEVVDYLRSELAPDARLYSYVPYALRYLTERPVVGVGSSDSAPAEGHHATRYLVLTPAVGTYLYMSPETAGWIEDNATLVKQVGRYSVYRLPAGTDADLDRLALHRTNYRGHPGSLPWFGRHP